MSLIIGHAHVFRVLTGQPLTRIGLVYDDFICLINKRERIQVLPTYEVFSH